MARTVLLADDSVTAQNMGRRILIDAGYEVVTVNNGSAALKRIHESPPDLIVLDVYMPGYGGLEVCQRLKESAQTAKIPVLLTVGKMEPFKTEEAKRAKADGHIIKPFDAGELLAALTRLEDRIVPQAASTRARKPKLEKEKKSKSSGTGFDPAMSYDDTHSDKIAYLEQVRARHSSDEPREEAEEVAQAEFEAAQSSATAASEMPRPMSVYAADALREMPVVAEPPSVGASEGNGYEQSTSLAADAAVDESVTQSALPDTAANETQDTEVRAISSASAGLSSSERSEADPEVEQPSRDEFSAPPETTAQPDAIAAAPESAPAAPSEPEPVVAKSRWVAENVAVSAEEAALELEREMQASSVSAPRAEIYEQTGAAEQENPAPESTPSVSETAIAGPAPSPTEDNGATFAAAAAASTGSIASASSPALDTPAIDAEAPPASETAAAWENWRHIRDSVMGSQTAVQLSESVAGAIQASSQAAGDGTVASAAEASQSKADAVEAPGEDSDSEALSSIVDSVLAELKPKLMAEISKKLKK